MDWEPLEKELARDCVAAMRKAGITREQFENQGNSGELICVHVDPKVGSVLDIKITADRNEEARYIWFLPHPAMGTFISGHYKEILEAFNAPVEL